MRKHPVVVEIGCSKELIRGSVHNSEVCRIGRVAEDDLALFFHDVEDVIGHALLRRTTQAQRPGPRDATIAPVMRWPGSLQRMVRPRFVHEPRMPELR